MRKLFSGFTLCVICASICFLLFNGCKKDFKDPRTGGLEKSAATQQLIRTLCTGLNDSFPATNYDGDSIERPTILGMQHANPYLIPNIRQAYTNLGVTINPTVTNYYVRFLPNSPTQLGALDSTLDAQGLDLFDAPMDYDVTQEGEYYQDPSIPMEQVTYQYAVVPTTFQFPTGIAYTTLAQIHIPDDAYSAVETEAERLAALQDCDQAAQSASTSGTQPNSCPLCQQWSVSQNKCVSYTCPAGYQCDDGGNGGCILTAPVPPTPPPPAPDAAIPAGNITVTDVNLGTNVGVRNARLVLKRWFKIQRLYTDNNGHFAATKHFKHKVKMVVKFKNNYADIKGVRGIRLWQMFYTISKTTGVYSGNKSNINFNFAQYSGYLQNYNSNNKGNRYWAGATVHNGVIEHADYASQFGFSPAPTGLRILLTNWAIEAGSSSAPMFGKRTDRSAISDAFVSVFLYGNNTGVPGGLVQAAAILTSVHCDIVLDYDDPNGSNQPFSSQYVKRTIYHEMSHASHLSKTGATWYGNFVTAELNVLSNYRSGSQSPYGDGSSGNSPLIEVGEGWAYFMGFFLANQRYSAPGKYDNNVFIQNKSTPASGPDLTALELFNPTLSTDPFRWIPKGLMLDLMDTGEPQGTAVIDAVSGYTIAQMFAALQSDVTSIPQYKARLVQLNPSNPTNGQINALFTSYGY